ncbi:MAG: STAS domain-containing protein [Anaerolineae bacterium]|nr:STAS domain-containing protein [Anaerolineae bacterium]
MQITKREENGISIFVLDGRIDSIGAAELDDALQAAVSEGKHKMILDMADVKYMNSAGLRTLADVLTHNRQNDGDLRLVALSSKVERVFKIIGFDKFFDTYETVEAALTGF